jgi:hypothetical protein
VWLGGVAPCALERPLRGPAQEEDRRGRRAWRAQGPGRPRLRRRRLLRRAVRGVRPGGGPLAGPREAPRLQAEGGRGREEAPGGGSGGAAGGLTLPRRREFLECVAGGWRRTTRRSAGCSSAWGGAERKDAGSERTRRVLEGRPEAPRGREARRVALRVRGRARCSPRARPAVRLLAQGRARLRPRGARTSWRAHAIGAPTSRRWRA